MLSYPPTKPNEEILLRYSGLSIKDGRQRMPRHQRGRQQETAQEIRHGYFLE